MRDRAAVVARHRDDLAATRARGRGALERLLDRQWDRTEHLRRHLRAVSPQHTLERGYAVVRHADGRIVRDQVEVEAEELLRVTVAHGDFAARVVGAPEVAGSPDVAEAPEVAEAPDVAEGTGGAGGPASP